jgi:hypothetical protein
MKFISLISLALFAYTAVATPFDRRAASQAVQDANKADAQALNQKFATLNDNSPCTNGENACVNGKFAQCANGKFSGTPCAGGEQCFALPLVNSRGTSLTCDTQADAIARGGILAGQGGGSAQNGTSQNGNGTGQNGSNTPKKGKKKSKKGKKGKKNTCNLNPPAAATTTPAAATPATTPATTTPPTTTPSTGGGGSLADTRKQNAVDAQKLQDSFATLNANSPCTSGQNACVNGNFATCSNGKFATTACPGGEQCFALPLVNKAGTSVTCDTQADRDARFAAAQNGQ